jgi:hypothetical protein
MTDQMAKAYINMKGVMRALVYLCDLDQEAAELIKSTNVTIQFSVKHGPAARLIFKDGKCSFEEGKGRSNVKLWFSSPGKFNSMMEGKGNPVILKGYTRLGFLLKGFSKLTKRLEYYLKPDENSSYDESYNEINTILTFFTAFNSLAEIGMHDPVGMKIMQKERNGIFCASIENTGYAVRLKMSKGQIKTTEDSDGSPEMHLIFSNLKKTNDLLNGRSDFLTAIGFGDVKVKGYLPVMQSVELLVPRLAAYLK